MAEAYNRVAHKRATLVTSLETVATERLIRATDTALNRLWRSYSTAELSELAGALQTRPSAPIVNRFERDLARVFGGDA